MRIYRNFWAFTPYHFTYTPLSDTYTHTHTYTQLFVDDPLLATLIIRSRSSQIGGSDGILINLESRYELIASEASSSEMRVMAAGQSEPVSTRQVQSMMQGYVIL